MGSCLSAQIEYGSTVGGEIKLALAVGDIDVMGKEEVRAEQHVGSQLFQPDITDQDVGMLDGLAAGLSLSLAQVRGLENSALTGFRRARCSRLPAWR